MEHFRGRYNPVKNLNLNLKRFWNKTIKSEALKETPQIRYSSVYMETMSWTDIENLRNDAHQGLRSTQPGQGH